MFYLLHHYGKIMGMNNLEQSVELTSFAHFARYSELFEHLNPQGDSLYFDGDECMPTF